MILIFRDWMDGNAIFEMPASRIPEVGECFTLASEFKDDVFRSTDAYQVTETSESDVSFQEEGVDVYVDVFFSPVRKRPIRELDS